MNGRCKRDPGRPSVDNIQSRRKPQATGHQFDPCSNGGLDFQAPALAAVTQPTKFVTGGFEGFCLHLTKGDQRQDQPCHCVADTPPEQIQNPHQRRSNDIYQKPIVALSLFRRCAPGFVTHLPRTDITAADVLVDDGQDVQPGKRIQTVRVVRSPGTSIPGARRGSRLPNPCRRTLSRSTRAQQRLEDFRSWNFEDRYRCSRKYSSKSVAPSTTPSKLSFVPSEGRYTNSSQRNERNEPGHVVSQHISQPPEHELHNHTITL